MTVLLSTKEVARLLNLNEKMIYALISDKKLPATKVTGKWLFPRHLVEQWVENNTMNIPDQPAGRLEQSGLLVFAGSDDILLGRSLGLLRKFHPEIIPAMATLGSRGGLRALRQGACHIATSHLMEDGNTEEYNFEHASRELGITPAVVNFCRREQGLLLPKDNPAKIKAVADLKKGNISIVNRPESTGTRLLFDQELRKAGIKPEKLPGYEKEVARHIDVGLEILSGRAGAGPGIRAVAEQLGLDFIPLRLERFDLLIRKGIFFNKEVQAFLELLTSEEFRTMAATIPGYDTEHSGKMVYPGKE
ncbi:MAG TPA: helix-turn-helix transcriptional regulator [Desulfomicrobiaceae bacterium]|nr:helix-turn-helix transcriptional regulator [Desulfomicrobiaceae bacterium]